MTSLRPSGFGVASHPLTPQGKTYAILDANALLAPRLSDILFDLQSAGFYSARWTAEIEAEFLRNWANVIYPPRRQKQPGFVMPALATIAAAPNRRLNAFRSATGPEYEIVGHMAAHALANVPAKVDAGDKHLASAALHWQSLVTEFEPNSRVVLVTKNVRHMAVSEMRKLGMAVVKPGAFIDAFLTVPADLEAVLLQTVSDLKNPPIKREDLLGALKLHGAAKTVAHFEQYWGLTAP